MAYPTLQELLGNQVQVQVLGSAYYNPGYNAAKALCTANTIPKGTRWVEFTVMGATLTISVDPAVTASATTGLDFPTGTYSDDWNEFILPYATAYDSTNTATIKMTFYGVQS